MSAVTTILDQIIEHKQIEVARRKAARPLSSLMADLYRAGPVRDFQAALRDPTRRTPRVIAEIKRQSPSKGLLRPDLDPMRVASIYQRNGAAAISVLADNRFFGGSLDDLSVVSAWVSVPVLCKEFIIDPYQLYEARMCGADAVLLIASLLDTARLRDLRELAEELGMSALVEVHNEAELDAALRSGAHIVGVNNRDLHTFTVSLSVTRRLLPLIPRDILCVSESGIRGEAGRAEMALMGVDAVLVGESLLVSDDLAQDTRVMCGLQPASLPRACTSGYRAAL